MVNHNITVKNNLLSHFLSKIPGKQLLYFIYLRKRLTCLSFEATLFCKINYNDHVESSFPMTDNNSYLHKLWEGSELHFYRLAFTKIFAHIHLKIHIFNSAEFSTNSISLPLKLKYIVEVEYNWSTWPWIFNWNIENKLFSISQKFISFTLLLERTFCLNIKFYSKTHNSNVLLHLTFLAFLFLVILVEIF